MKKMYIAVIDEAPDYMVPTLVAHSILNAHTYFTSLGRSENQRAGYYDWWRNSFRKVVLKVPHGVFHKIHTSLDCWAGHENTICNGAQTCLVVEPVESDNVPNVLKWAKMWKPEETLPDKPPLPEPLKHPAYLTEDEIVAKLPQLIRDMLDSVSSKVEVGTQSTIHEYSAYIAAIYIGYYRVSAEDTLSEIAERTGTDWRELARINDLSNPDLIFPGQLIKLR